MYLNKEKARKKLTKAGAIKLLKYIKNRLIQNNIKIETDALYSNYLDLIECWLKKPNVNTLQQILSTYSINHQTRKEIEIIHSEQVFVSEITYIKTN